MSRQKPAHEELLPEVLTLAVGETRDGRAALVLVTSRGPRVLSAHVVDVHPDRESVERNWLDVAWKVFGRGDAAPAALADAPVVDWFEGLGLQRSPTAHGTWAVVGVDQDHGGGVTVSVRAKETSRLEAWNEMERQAAQTLLLEQRRSSLRAQTGAPSTRNRRKSG